VHFAGKVGADALAERLRQALAHHGVHAHLAVDPASPTGTTVALEFSNGQRHFLSCLPNNQSVTFRDLDLAALDGCTHLLRADIWFSESMLEGGNQQLLSEARRRQMTTSLDINFDPCWRSTAPGTAIARRIQLVRESLPLVDLAHGNIAELCRFAGSADLNTALARLADWGAGAVVVHMGRQGAGFYVDGVLTIEPPAWARTTVHATGTGDILSVCMILLQDRRDLSVREKLRLANLVVREFLEGTRQMIPII
jgi:sugar/nucleoside kinase (ribokinase family)